MKTGALYGIILTERHVCMNRETENVCTYDGVGHLQHLFKQRVGLLVTTARVYDDYLKVLRLKLLYAFLSNDDRVSFCVAVRHQQQSWIGLRRLF